MSDKTRILILEHNPDDAELILHELQTGGLIFVSELVKNEKSYRNAIKKFIPHIILSDYSLPSFDGDQAFKIREDTGSNVPFIFVSGSIGEERSIDYIKNGVTDYVLKDKLFTLAVKVKRALKDAKEKEENAKTAKALLISESMLSRAQQLAQLGSWELNFSDNLLALSAEGCRIFGLPPGQNQLAFDTWKSLVHPEDIETVLQTINTSTTTLQESSYQHRIILKDGTIKDIHSESKFEFDENGKPAGMYGIMQDVTQRKKSELSLVKAYEEKNAILESIDDGFFAVDENSIITYWNKRAEILLHVKKEDIIGKNLHDVFADNASKIFYDNYQKAISKKTTVYFEGFSIRTNKWFAVSAFGSVNGLSVYFKDVSGRKNSEDKIKESELRYRSIIEQATDAICIADSSMKIIDINPQGCKMLGYSKEEFVQLTIADLFLAEDLMENPFKIAELKVGGIIRNERRFKTKDGLLIEIELSARILEDGKFIVFGHDIAERKKAENKIKESELRYRSLNEQATDAICITNASLRFIDINPYACEIFGYSKEEALQLSLPDILFAEDLESNPLKVAELQLGKTIRNERRLKRKNGTAVNMEVSTRIMEDGRMIMFGHDITERKIAERQKEFDRINLNALINNTTDLMWSVDKNCKLITFNQPFLEIIRFVSGKEIAEGDDVFSVVLSPDQHARFKTSYARALAGESFIDIEHITSPVESWSEISYYPIRNGLEIIGTACHSRDITGRKKAEMNLAKSEEQYRQIVETAQEGIWLIDENDYTSFVNKKMCEIVEYSQQELIGKKIYHFMDDESRENALLQIERRKLGLNEIHDSSFITKSGKLVWVNISTNPIVDEYGNYKGALAMITDITARKRAEQEMTWLINNTEESFILLDQNLDIISFNSQFYRLYLKYLAITVVKGDSILKYAQPARLALVTEIYKRVLEGAEETGEIDIQLPGNTVKNFELKYKPAKDEQGKIIGAFVSAIDITEKKKSEQRLIIQEKRYRALVENGADAVVIISAEGKLQYASPTVEKILGYTEEEILKLDMFSIGHPDDFEELKNVWEQALASPGIALPGHTGRMLHKNGTWRWLEATVTNMLHDPALHGIVDNFRDVTEKRQLENLLNKSNSLARIGSWELDLIKGSLYWSDITKEVHETALDFTPSLQTGINFYKEGWSRDLITQKVQAAIEMGLPFDVELQIITVKGNEKWIRAIGETEFENDKAVKISGSFQDIDIRKRAELGVKEVLEEKNSILESIDDAFFAVDKNWIVTYWNSQAEKVLRKAKTEMLDHNLWEVFSDSIDSESYIKYHQAIETNQSVHFEDYYPALEKWYEISAYPSDNGLSVYFKDVSDRKLYEMQLNELNANLRKQAKALTISNADLEQFAYVASHDLQEPLRMITSFLSLLQKKYGVVIDDKGKQYIEFAVDGAKRMRQIILDLLEFSRKGRTEDEQEDIDLNELIDEIQILFRKDIQDKNAAIITNALPHIPGYKSPLRQVFQNLISNALKYAVKDRPVEITITCTELPDHWQFAIRDTGIGIDQEYFDKIFIIFQRLHNKDEFSGTGMGLAITKKIIENMGGRIWVESEEGKGSTFYFTLLKTILT